jgi:hypothetical protein
MHRWSPLVVVTLIWIGAVAGLRAQDVPLEELLRRMGDYVEAYERYLSAVVSEESYEQTVAPMGMLRADLRRLKSEVLLTRIGDEGWVAFRDVVEVDGKPVTDRADRLVQLFLKPTGDSTEQFYRIVQASAQYNLGWVRRSINVPTMVLQFAKAKEQHRSQFRRGGTTKIGEIEARELRFTERKMPRVIQTPDNAAASGSFWIDEVTGRILRTEMRVTTGSTSATISVSYGHQPKLDIWLPIVMTEKYTTPRQPAINGRATYSNFRRFDVQVATIIKTP